MSDIITQEENRILGIIRYNRMRQPIEVNRAWNIGQLTIEYNKRSSKNLWGRFGGGWQWNLGIQASEGFRQVIVNVLVCSFSISRRRRR